MCDNFNSYSECIVCVSLVFVVFVVFVVSRRAFFFVDEVNRVIFRRCVFFCFEVI